LFSIAFPHFLQHETIMRNHTHTTHSSSFKWPAKRLYSICVLLALLVLLFLSGCATPMDARKDATFQSYAYTADRPTVRPTRSLSSFSESLMCMDRMLRESQIPTTLITSKAIPDFSSRVPAAAKDMIITALSQMSRLSHAFRYVDYEVDIARQDTVQNLTTILLNNNQMQLQRPALYVSGAIAYVDQNVINNRFDAGTSASRLDTGYSQSKNATVIGLELHLGDFRTRTLIPGLDSANEVIIGGAGQGLDLAGRIGNYGVKFNVGRDYSIGAGGALRTLIDLGMIEMVGKWARVPYWQCLTLEQTDPNFQRQMRDWYDEGAAMVHNKLVQRSLMSQGYLAENSEKLEERSPAMVSALGRFQADSGLAVTGVVDFATYERALRGFVALSASGQLSQVGWSSGGTTVKTSVNTTGLATTTMPISGSPYLQAALGAPALPRRLELQLENPLVGRPAFEIGEQIFLSASLSRASYLYCFLHEAGGTVMRLLPNATNPSALISANIAIRIPDWMSPTPGFIMDATSAGTERVGCYATDKEVADKIPAILGGTSLVTLKGVAGLQTINQAFEAALGKQGYTTTQIQWLVGPKAAMPAAASPPPAAPVKK
jgi:hypothetical protein